MEYQASQTNFGYTDDGKMNIETQIAGYGSTHIFESNDVLAAFPAPSASSQFSFRSLTTWQEIVDRVTRVGINGEVFALGFDAYNMTYYSGFSQLRLKASWSARLPTILKTHACLQDPKKLVVARCTAFGGMTHRGFQGVLRTSDLYGGDIDGSLGGPGCETSNIIEVGTITFSEEL